MGILNYFHERRIDDVDWKHPHIFRKHVVIDYHLCLQGHYSEPIRRCQERGFSAEEISEYIADLVESVDKSFPRIIYTAFADLCSG